MALPAQDRHETKVRRGEMRGGGQAFTGLASIDKGLRERIKQYDKDLELHQIGRQVHAYRVILYGATASDDQLFHQFVLKHAPGEWLIECLNQSDQWKKFGSEKKATKEQMKLYMNPETAKQRDARLRLNDCSQNAAKEIIKYIERGRRGVWLGGKTGSSRSRRKFLN